MLRRFAGIVGVAVGIALASGFATPARADISYTCDPSVAVSTCTYLNTTIAGLYNSTFTNADADIYITYGTTGLAQTQTAFNTVSYSDYVAALAANPGEDALQASALSALSTYDVTPYGSGNVNITASLAQALGLNAGSLNGVPAGSSTPCALGSPGCYN